jgi:hypothetical protein
VFPGVDEDPVKVEVGDSRFSITEIKSSMLDDLREEDERAGERELREPHASVKAARAVVSTVPGRAETLALDWRRAPRFYAKFGITEDRFRYGSPEEPSDEAVDSDDLSTIAGTGARRFGLP